MDGSAERKWRQSASKDSRSGADSATNREFNGSADGIANSASDRKHRANDGPRFQLNAAPYIGQQHTTGYGQSEYGHGARQHSAAGRQYKPWRRQFQRQSQLD